MTRNGYVDASIQKGAIEGFSRCLEHTGVLSQLIQEAKEKKGNLTFVWLDFANAYGSIPSNLVQVAMDHYHISHHIQGMITNYLGATIPVSHVYIKVATSGERNSNKVYHFPHLVRLGNEPDHLCSYYKVKGTKDCSRKPTASYQGIHG